MADTQRRDNGTFPKCPLPSTEMHLKSSICKPSLFLMEKKRGKRHVSTPSVGKQQHEDVAARAAPCGNASPRYLAVCDLGPFPSSRSSVWFGPEA